MDTPSIVGNSATDSHSQEMAKQRKEEEDSKNHPVSVNGHKLSVGDLYSSHYDRKDFISKLKLLDAGKRGGAAQAEPGNVSPGESDTEEEDEDPKAVEDQLFGGQTEGKSSKP